jgi:hypothetical protein
MAPSRFFRSVSGRIEITFSFATQFAPLAWMMPLRMPVCSDSNPNAYDERNKLLKIKATAMNSILSSLTRFFMASSLSLPKLAFEPNSLKVFWSFSKKKTRFL